MAGTSSEHAELGLRSGGELDDSVVGDSKSLCIVWSFITIRCHLFSVTQSEQRQLGESTNRILCISHDRFEVWWFGHLHQGRSLD